ncbi:MAG TPA: ABC transporter permease [Symbiobacteriaceae bacterium]|jgi:peptide/nickel transport system permease protein|nr:ABC transporter permease [Symbiobacteriaceae bacterium]
MLKYLMKRILISLPVILGVTVISYLIISLAPGDAVDLMVDPTMSKADIEQRREDLGLNDPIHVRYVKWLGHVVQGDLGYSYTNSQPVAQRIGERLVPTLGLSLTALVLAYLVAIPVGVISATRQYSWIDYTSSILALVGVSIPGFFLGIGLIYVFSLRLDLLPVSGMRSLGVEESMFDLAKHMILPAIVLSASTMGNVTRNARSAMLDVVRQDYIRTSRAKGVGERVTIYRHALRNALIPIITLFGLQIPGLLGGAIITEQIFSWPGMGRLSIEAISSRDYPVLMGLNLMAALLVVIGGLISDIMYSLADPRIRFS